MSYKGKCFGMVSVMLAVLLTALAGCGGEEKESRVQLESLNPEDGEAGEEQSGAGKTGGTETDRKEAGAEGTDGEHPETVESGSDDMQGDGDGTGGRKTQDDTGASGDPGSSDGSSEAGTGSRPVPQIVENPFVNKLTEEGQGWGLGFGEPGAQPSGNVTPEELAQYSAYFMGGAEEKVIYLTFDCGYENGNTEPILDALKKHEAPGTFFVVGHYLETQPELVKRMVEEGHAVGNHTYHHYDINTLDEETFLKELEDVATLFQEITGQELSPYYRPPEGKCGSTNLKLAQKAGYFTCFWSLAHVDWDVDNQPSHQAALEKLTSRIHPGAIVLLHNTSRTNGEILDELLTEWEEMGYTFAPLSNLVQ